MFALCLTKNLRKMDKKTKKLEKLSVADLMFGKELLESDVLDLIADFEDKYGLSVRHLYVESDKDDGFVIETSLDV